MAARPKHDVGFVMVNGARSAHSCPMKVTEDIRKYAAVAEARSKECAENGAKIHAKA